MVRTALYGLTAALGLALPVAAGSAQAHPPVPYPTYPVPYPSHPTYYPPACTHWRVLYRTCDREPWRRYATYESEHQARRAAHHLRYDGYEVRVVAAG